MRLRVKPVPTHITLKTHFIYLALVAHLVFVKSISLFLFKHTLIAISVIKKYTLSMVQFFLLSAQLLLSQ